MIDKCPLCGSLMTRFGYSHSDGDWAYLPKSAQQCKNKDCELPVRLWGRVGALVSFWEGEHEYPSDIYRNPDGVLCVKADAGRPAPCRTSTPPDAPAR